MIDLQEASAMFMRNNFAEAKDLLKTFVTVVSTVLIFSVTFGEKIIDLRNGARLARWSLFAAWVMFILAIITSGVALASMVIANGANSAGSALVDQAGFYENAAFYLAIIADVAFVGGLVAMVYAALLSMQDSRARLPHVSNRQEPIA